MFHPLKGELSRIGCPTARRKRRRLRLLQPSHRVLDLVPRGRDQALGDVLEADPRVAGDLLDALALEPSGDRFIGGSGAVLPERCGPGLISKDGHGNQAPVSCFGALPIQEQLRGDAAGARLAVARPAGRARAVRRAVVPRE